MVAYGALLSERLLAGARTRLGNLHFSLLPAWRGAAPVQAAIAAGDAVTGATTFQIEPALDSGPIYGVVTETIRATDTAGDLLDRLAVSGAALLGDHAGRCRRQIAGPRCRSPPRVSASRPRSPSMRRACDGDLPAHVVERRIRAVTPNPGAWTMIGDLRVKLGPVTVDDARTDWRPVRSGRPRGRAHRYGSQPVGLSQVQPPGKKPMNAADWARGARLDESARAESRLSPATKRPPRAASRSIPPAAPRSTCCGPYRSATRTPTWCCRRCCGNVESPAATPHSPPN